MSNRPIPNAADETRLAESAKLLKNLEDRDREDLRKTLSTIEGRRFVWKVLSHTKTFNSIWEQSAKIHYNAGQQDVGHYIMTLIEDADTDALFTMMREAKGDRF